MTIICGLSELLPVKNISGIIAAVKNLPVQLLVVGDGGEFNYLQRIAGKNVKFLGQIPNQKVRELLKKSDIFVLNSTHEGLPHALLEALAEGVAVIATKIPATEEILIDGETGLFVEINKPADLAKIIEKLSSNPTLRKKLAINGKKLFLQKFTWESHIKALYNVFNEVTSHSVGVSAD